MHTSLRRVYVVRMLCCMPQLSLYAILDFSGAGLRRRRRRRPPFRAD